MATNRTRENMLGISLGLLVFGIALFYLYLITLGIVLNILGVGLGILVLGCLHYVIWGRAFSREVASEREALQRQELRRELHRSERAPADSIQDLTRTHRIQK